MTIERYIKDYCDNSYKVFLERQKAGKIKQTGFKFAAYEDITYYEDVENGILFEDLFYIGD